MQTAMTNLSEGDHRLWVHLISTYVISWYIYKVISNMLWCQELYHHIIPPYLFIVTTLFDMSLSNK